MLMKVPLSILKKHSQLSVLCEKYPDKIPLTEAAEFLSIDKEGLRSSIEQGRCQFGLCVKKSLHGNRAFTINTYAFYNRLTNGAIFRTLIINRTLGKPRKYKHRA